MHRGFDPIDQDEMLAFKKAIASTTAIIAPVVSRVSAVTGTRDTDSMPGFENTQLLASGGAASPLGATQFGDLK